MIPIEFPPGVTALSSKNAKILNWRESHLMRWHETTLKPVLGWEKYKTPVFASKLRKMHRWTRNDGTIITAYLCEQHVYIERDGVFTDITPAGGMAVPIVNIAGYGDDLYSFSKYGTPRPGDSRLNFTTNIYSLSNWGEELRAMTSADGRYLGWKPSDPPGTKMTAVTGAPVGNRAFIITPERHAMLFGMNAFDRFGWSDEEDDTNWAFGDILSRARYYDVYPKSYIITQQLMDVGILMFTPAMSYLIEWQGLPYVYSYRPIGEISVPISPASLCPTPLGVMWVATDGWWIFDGTAPRTVPCDVWDWIVDNVDMADARFTGACVHLGYAGEVWWFFPDKDSPTGFNNRYAMFDYRAKTWATGRLGRICGFVYPNSVFPILSDGINVWKHNSGLLYPDADMPWIESQNLAPDGGEHYMTLKRILPDVQGDSDAIRWRVVKSNARDGYETEIFSPQRKKNGSGFVDIRESARDMRLRIEMVKSADWGTIGPILFDMSGRGKK